MAKVPERNDKMFTIIICTYNGGRRIERVVDCIVKQEGFDILVKEVLIVDNCSTDYTAKVIKQLMEKNNRIKYLYEPQPGLSNARLCGINKANTPWIIFLDDDNFINEKWLCGITEYITMHKDMGAFNGRVIPRCTEILTDEQNYLLKVAYAGLACTCYSDEQNISIEEYEWMPFGAGLVILREPLVDLARNGWLKSVGRKQNNIISGEDTEMVEWVKKMGFQWGFCEKVSMYHEIDITRLDIEYLKRLYNSFGESYYKILSQKNFYVLRHIKWGMIEGFHFVRAYILNMIGKKEMVEEFYRNELEMSRVRGFFHAFALGFSVVKEA